MQLQSVKELYKYVDEHAPPIVDRVMTVLNISATNRANIYGGLQLQAPCAWYEAWLQKLQTENYDNQHAYDIRLLDQWINHAKTQGVHWSVIPLAKFLDMPEDDRDWSTFPSLLPTILQMWWKLPADHPRK